MAAPPFSFPRPAPHSPHVSTTGCTAIYAIAIAAIGPRDPHHDFLPVGVGALGRAPKNQRND